MVVKSDDRSCKTASKHETDTRNMNNISIYILSILNCYLISYVYRYIPITYHLPSLPISMSPLWIKVCAINHAFLFNTLLLVFCFGSISLFYIIRPLFFLKKLLFIILGCFIYCFYKKISIYVIKFRQN